jgi:hypothetical protein
MAKKCSANNRKGKRCGALVLTGETKCALHLDPKRAAKLGAQHGRKAVLLGDNDLGPMEPPKTARDVRDALAYTMVQVHDRKIDARTANALAYIATSLLRAIEVSDLENRLTMLEELGGPWEIKFPSSTTSLGGGPKSHYPRSEVGRRYIRNFFSANIRHFDFGIAILQSDI